MGVAIGIDSHKRSLGAGATDELGREVAAKEFPKLSAGSQGSTRLDKGAGNRSGHRHRGRRTEVRCSTTSSS